MAEDSLYWDGTSTGHAGSTDDVWSAPYSSADVADMFSVLLGSDSARAFVLPGIGSNLYAQANSPAAMNVVVGTGRAFVRGRIYGNTAAKTLTIIAADSTNPRIDRIVLRITLATQIVEAVVLTGTPSSSPSLPALTQTAAVYELPLANVWVAAGATSIADSEVHDDRTFGANAEGMRLSSGQQQRILNSEFLCPITQTRTFPPANWTLVSTPSGIITATKPSQMTRGYALQITADGANEGIQQSFAVKPSTPYVFKILYNVTAGDVGSVVVTDNGTSPPTITRNLRRIGSWLEELIYYTTTSNATEITFSIRANNSTDVIQVGQVLALEGYVPGAFRAIYPTEGLTLLDQIVVESASSSAVFHTPTTGFKHLRIEAIGRTNEVADRTIIAAAFNSDVTTLCDRGFVRWDGTSWGDTEAYGVDTIIVVGYLAGANAPANTRGIIIIDIPDYMDTTFYNTIHATWGHIVATSAPGFHTGLATGRRRSATAITRIALALPGGVSHDPGAVYSLYGYN